MTGFYEPDEVKEILESAGRTTLMLPPNGAKPMGYRSCWPEIVRDFRESYGWEKLQSPKLRANSAQMDEYAMVEDWKVKLSIYCRKRNMPYISRAVNYGMLRWPDSNKPVYNWSKLSRKLHCSPPTAKAWYLFGIDTLTKILKSHRVVKSHAESVEDDIFAFTWYKK